MGFKAAEEYEKLNEWCLGDKNAVNFLRATACLSQIADDFVDRDVPPEEIDSEKMLQLLHIALVDIPTNPFYRQNEKWLLPVMLSSIMVGDATNDWKDSEHTDTRMFAYAYREICEQIIFMVAKIVGGFDHAREVIRDVHDFYHVKYPESFKEWDEKEKPHE